jgi:protein-disulfide isomerase
MDNPKADLAIPVDATDHALGHRHAGVVLVEYGDFECPSCKQAAPVVKLLLRQFPLGLRLVFRQFPLAEVHPHALEASLAAETAGAQHKFWPMHDLLFDNQSRLKAPVLRRCAERLELDMTRYDLEMSDTVHLQRVREHIDSGVRSGVRATPTFFLDGRRVDVSFGLEALAREVEAAVLACGPVASGGA